MDRVSWIPEFPVKSEDEEVGGFRHDYSADFTLEDLSKMKRKKEVFVTPIPPISPL